MNIAPQPIVSRSHSTSLIVHRPGLFTGLALGHHVFTLLDLYSHLCRYYSSHCNCSSIPRSTFRRLYLVSIHVYNSNCRRPAHWCSSPSKPCKLGCCSNGGVCGLGPTFCGAGNCTSSCDQKSECDPGWGSKWSSKEKCPLNVCCSKFGFCGTTKEFCGDKTVKKPSGNGATSNQRTIGMIGPEAFHGIKGRSSNP